MDATRGRDGTTTANWIEGPYNRWGYRHVRELTRTARVSRGTGPVFDLSHAPLDLSGLAIEHGRRSLTFEQWIEETYTDGLLVLHDGAIAVERYAAGTTVSDTHLLMSVSKSLTSVLCGALFGRGLLAPSALVTAYVPELAGTSWDGCTVQHLLDMRAGTRWNYEVDEHLILDVSDYRTHDRADLPADTETWIRTIGNAGEHGGPFHYTSLMIDVLAWCAEQAGGERFSDLFSQLIWSRIGAEHDADLILDASGFPIAEGGFCATLRDTARFGLMCLQHGEIGGHQVVPADWLARLYVRDETLVDAFREWHDPGLPRSFYHDCWWVWDAERGIYEAFGMSGQSILIHHPSGTVIAKHSTFPVVLDDDLYALQTAGYLAICDSLLDA